MRQTWQVWCDNDRGFLMLYCPQTCETIYGDDPEQTTTTLWSRALLVMCGYQKIGEL